MTAKPCEGTQTDREIHRIPECFWLNGGLQEKSDHQDWENQERSQRHQSDPEHLPAVRAEIQMMYALKQSES